MKANVDYLKVETIIRWTPLLGGHHQVGLNFTLSETEMSSRAALRAFALDSLDRMLPLPVIDVISCQRTAMTLLHRVLPND